MHKQVLTTLLASLALAACGGDVEPTADSSLAPTPAPERTEAAPPPSSDSGRTVAVDDIDRWQRGMEAELAAVQAAAAQWAQAKDENAKLDALSAATEMNTITAGAEAAGVDPDRYRRIRNTLSDAVSQLSPIEMELDVETLPAEMIEQMQQARSASAARLQQELPADVFTALQTRAADVRKQEKLLVAERLKVAASAR